MHHKPLDYDMYYLPMNLEPYVQCPHHLPNMDLTRHTSLTAHHFNTRPRPPQQPPQQ